MAALQEFLGENATANLEIKLCEVRTSQIRVYFNPDSTHQQLDVHGLATHVVSKDPLSYMGQLKAVLKIYYPIVEPT